MPSAWLARPPRTASGTVSFTAKGPMTFLCDASPGSRGSSCWQTYMVGIADTTLHHAPSWARCSAVRSTAPQHSSKPLSWCAPAKHANSMPRRSTSPLSLQTIPLAWPFVVWGLDILGPFPRAPGGYSTSTSPSTSSPSGRRWRPSAPSQLDQPSSSSKAL